MTTREAQRLVQDLVYGAEERGRFVGELARIALSDDDAETRERHVMAALARATATMPTILAQGISA